MIRNELLDTIKEMLRQMAYTSVHFCTDFPSHRVREARKPAFFIKLTRADSFPEEPLLEDLEMTISIIVENHSDTYGEASLYEINTIIEEIRDNFSVLGGKAEIHLLLRLDGVVGPYRYENDAFITRADMNFYVSM